ncbi:MAG: cell division protein SepF [Oscillospiraceae bacterium]|nr:cell division protein SepF [Oscillospiraceae bacterium]
MGMLDNIKAFLSDNTEDDLPEEESYEPQPAPRQERPLPPNGTRAGDDNRLNISLTAQLRVILVKPEKFTDTKEIANHLNNKQTVVLNLESTTPDVTRRIIDFLGGVAYANGGSIKPVANNTFIITPYTVSFQGDELSEQLESNGVFL